MAQTQTPTSPNTTEAQPGPQPSSPAAASSPHQRNVTGKTTPEAAPNGNSAPVGASSPHQRSATRIAEGESGGVSSGTAVDDRSGQTLGKVAEVVRDKSGQRWVVVSGTTKKSATPVPYDVASSAMADGKVVLDREAFEQAPKVKRTELSKGTGRWQTKVEEYWQQHAR